MILTFEVFRWNWYSQPVVLYFLFGPCRSSRMKVITWTILTFCEGYDSFQRIKSLWARRSMGCCRAAFWFQKGNVRLRAFPVRCHCGESRTAASMTELIAIEADWTSSNRFLTYSLCSEVIAFCSWWFTNVQPFLRSGVLWLLSTRCLLSGDRWQHNQHPLLSPYGFCMAFCPERWGIRTPDH